MLLKSVYVRFYKSFNFDYLRKYHPLAKSRSWELIDTKWYPFVEIPIDKSVTTIVGANESGKSHLLSAITKGITGEKIERKDFCRYSNFFTVDESKMLYPDFGFEWGDLSSSDKEKVRKLFAIDEKISFDSFLLFRKNKDNIILHIPASTEIGYKDFPLTSKESELKDILPIPFSIDPEIVLPASVPINSLIEDHESSLSLLSRKDRFSAVEATETLLADAEKFSTEASVTTNAPFISKEMTQILGTFSRKNSDIEKDELLLKGIDLAKDLIFKIAKIDRKAIVDMYSAMKEGDHGHVNALIQQINKNLANRLNFPRWWVQDKDFQLIVSARDFDIVFTIKDKTQTEYSFEERSSGLRNFLSYYIQYRAHDYIKGRQEILLMDEPDAFLSSQAQQDLIKIFQAFAEPEDSEVEPIQVIYVTHSPFLIDKNHAERVRVLQKGVDFEGTRVVDDASKNHYEPLRSTLGSLVGETAYMGNCNLIVEGVADQILLSGLSQLLYKSVPSRNDVLDLNNITIVPAGGASHIPYLAYLARGRDVEKPAVIVLLDSDSQGDQQKRALKRGGANNKQVLKEEYILQIGDLTTTHRIKPTRLIESEDLIPLAICVRAAKKYAKEICYAEEKVIDTITSIELENQLNVVPTSSIFDAMKKIFEASDHHIEKIGFARCVLEVTQSLEKTEETLGLDDREALSAFKENMIVLFQRINHLKRAAMKESNEEKMSQKIERLKTSFLRDFPMKAAREEANILFFDIENTLVDSAESDCIKSAMMRVRRDFDLDRDVHLEIKPYPDFTEAINGIKYSAINKTATTISQPAIPPVVVQATT